MQNLKYVSLPQLIGEFEYYVCAYTGSLIQTKKKGYNYVLPNKVAQALKVCDNPYLCSSLKIQSNILSDNISQAIKLNRMHQKLILLSNKRFLLSRLYASLRNPIFETTRDAMQAIACIPLQLQKREQLCLQRSLLAIKISKSFKESGVLFIGASLPTGNMHAWIIENNNQPDIDDREWILYKPLLAFYY